MGREFELKYAATEHILAAIAAQYPGGRRFSMQTTYYDTAERALSARKMTLRIRQENSAFLCTLKTPLADGSRGEWEYPAQSIDEGIRGLLAVGAPRELAALTAAGVQAVCGARFTRTAIEVPTIDGIAELALDAGVLTGGARTVALWEVEVELKSGSEPATTAFARLLATQYGLKEEPQSKFHRALALAQGE